MMFSAKRIKTWAVLAAGSVVGAGALLGTAPVQAASVPESLSALTAAHPAMQQSLSFNDSGKWVYTLQADLLDNGFAVPQSGIMDQATVLGLERFQESKRLVPTGVSTPQTWQDLLAHWGITPAFSGGSTVIASLTNNHPALDQVLNPGSRGHWVLTLQANLKELGYPVGPLDGIFGPKTEAALTTFQSAHNLPASGVTNAPTWQTMLYEFGITPDFQPADLVVSNGTVHLTAAPQPPNPPSSPTSSSSAPTVTTTTTGTANTIDGYPVLKVIHMTATAYGPSLQDNYPYGPVDYFGQPLEPGMVAVDPSVIPLKTHVYVTGYTDGMLPKSGFLGQAMDEGGAIKGNRIDIYMNANPLTVSNFGIEPVTVYVLG